MSAWLDADWPAPRGVRALTTLRHGLGVSRAPFDSFNLGLRCGDAADAVLENRRQLEAALALPSPPRWLKQVHGIDVARFDGPHPNPPPQAVEGDGSRPLPLPPQAVEGDGSRPLPLPPQAVEGDGSRPLPLPPQAVEGDGSRPLPLPPQAGEGDGSRPLPLPPQAAEGDGSRPLPLPPLAGEGWDGGEPEADASVTSTPGVVLAILTADCLPVVFTAKDGSEIAAAHAGWRGLVDGMLEAAVAAMRMPANDIIAWLGPCAGPQAYEIGQEVFDAFVARDASASSAFVATRPGHWRVDLYALARQRLAKAGIAPHDIHGGGLCTISDPSRFFSHRRDQRGGRMATLAWIES